MSHQFRKNDLNTLQNNYNYYIHDYMCKKQISMINKKMQDIYKMTIGDRLISLTVNKSDKT